MGEAQEVFEGGRTLWGHTDRVWSEVPDPDLYTEQGNQSRVISLPTFVTFLVDLKYRIDKH